MEGPWNDEDCPVPKVFRPSSSTTFTQTKMEEIVSEYNERKLIYVYDPHYNSGKSIFTEHLEYKGLAEEIPPFVLMEDIMQFVMCQPIAKCYIFDMPAAMKKENWA